LLTKGLLAESPRGAVGGETLVDDDDPQLPVKNKKKGAIKA